MSDYLKSQRRRWIRTAVLIVICGALALAIEECSSVYTIRRQAQNATDAATLAGARRLARVLQEPALDEASIEAEMREFAAHNGVTGGDTVVGYYLDAGCNRLGPVGSGLSRELSGIEAVVTTRADSFLTRLLGLPGWPVQTEAVACFEIQYPEDGGTPWIIFPGLNMDPVE